MPKRIAFGFAVAATLMGGSFDWNLPRGFPRPAIPSDNPMSTVKVQLGQYLYPVEGASARNSPLPMDENAPREQPGSCTPAAA